MSSTDSQWKHLPVPDEPDKHTEHDQAARDVPGGLKLLGARVRGKKHKHEGTNCDDWFELAVSDPWTIIAVADGAGSKKFSRVGAEASCRAAVMHLAEKLQGHRLSPDGILNALNRDETNGVFAGEDLEQVQHVLHEAVGEAYRAVQKAADQRAGDDQYTRLLGRTLTVNDLSATLLLAVHTLVPYEGQERSLVLACQVGDGMIAAVDHQGRLQLLAEPDSGAYSGETEFLTSANKREKDNLWRKTFGFFRPLRALLVMTDGVADDYFPNDPGLLQLHAELVLNQILALQGPSDDEIQAALQATSLPTFAAVEQADFHALVAAGTAEEELVAIASAATYADKLGLPLDKVVASPPLLCAGSRGRPLCTAATPQDRLRVWLDSYYVRGSFDDRTLAILFRETLQ